MLQSPLRQWVACATAVVAVLFPVLLAYLVSRAITHPPWYHFTVRTLEQGLNYDYVGKPWGNVKGNPKTEFGIDFEDVEFSGPFNSTLRGWYIPPPSLSSLGVVAVHGAGVDRREFLRMVPFLHKNGNYHLLLFDCREHGISAGSFQGASYAVREHLDAIYAVKYFRQKHKLSGLGIIGTSQGGTAALLAAAKERSIDAVISENPLTDLETLFTEVIETALQVKPDWSKDAGVASVAAQYGQWIPMWFRRLVVQMTLLRLTFSAEDYNDAIQAVKNITQPLFLLHGTSDEMISHQHSARLYEAANEPKTLWIAKDATHAALFNLYSKEYEEKVLSFLRQHLRH